MTFALALASGLAASAGAFFANRRFVRTGGNRALWLAAPALEEALKSGIAFAAGAPLIAAHFVFGAVEGVYEASGRRPSPTAALLSVVTHTFFGLLTVLFAARSGPAAAVAAVAAIHALFNVTMLGAAAVAGTRRGA